MRGGADALLLLLLLLMRLLLPPPPLLLLLLLLILLLHTTPVWRGFGIALGRVLDSCLLQAKGVIWGLGIPINSIASHWLGLKNVMTAADVMYIYYGFPTAPLRLAPIPTLCLCLGRVVGALWWVVRLLYAVPPAHNHHSLAYPRGGRGLYDSLPFRKFRRG